MHSANTTTKVVTDEQGTKTFGAGMFQKTAGVRNGKGLMFCLHLIDQISAESQTLYTRESQTHVGFTILLSDLIDGMVCGNDLLLAYP